MKWAEELTGQNVCMMYTEAGYAKVIQAHGFTLQGWPLKVLRLPAAISLMHKLTTLEETLKAQECMWVQLSDKELKVQLVKDAERREMEPGRMKRKRSGSNTKGMAKKAKVKPIIDSDSNAQEDKEVY